MKAFDATNIPYTSDVIDLLSLQVTADYAGKIIDEQIGKENSTVTYSVGGLILSNSGAITANYWLSKIYYEEIGEMHRHADLHVHDLSMLTGYCAGWSLKQLIQEGISPEMQRPFALCAVDRCAPAQSFPLPVERSITS